jgi:hypothetical protein
MPTLTWTITPLTPTQTRLPPLLPILPTPTTTAVDPPSTAARSNTLPRQQTTSRTSDTLPLQPSTFPSRRRIRRARRTRACRRAGRTLRGGRIRKRQSGRCRISPTLAEEEREGHRLVGEEEAVDCRRWGGQWRTNRIRLSGGRGANST